MQRAVQQKVKVLDCSNREIPIGGRKDAEVLLRHSQIFFAIVLNGRLITNRRAIEMFETLCQRGENPVMVYISAESVDDAVVAVVSLLWDITGKVPKADIFRSLDLPEEQLCESQLYRILPGARCREAEEDVIDVIPVGATPQKPPAAAPPAATPPPPAATATAAPTASTVPAPAATPAATLPPIKQPQDVKPSMPPAEKLCKEILDAGGIELLEVLTELIRRRGVDEVIKMLKKWVA
jgi:hypothetical protein